MKNEIIYRAKAVKIGKIASEKNCYFLDIIGADGNQQTIATGSLSYVKSYMNKVELY